MAYAKTIMHGPYSDPDFCNVCFIPASKFLKRNEMSHILPKSIMLKKKLCHNLCELSPVQMIWFHTAHKHFVRIYGQLFLRRKLVQEELSWNTYYSSLNTNYLIDRNNHFTCIDNNNSRDSNDSNNNNNNNNRDDNIMNDFDNEDMEIGNRDWLDNFYILSRIFILFSIIYFYSSPIRFLVVTILGLLIYLYHSGLLGVIQNVNNNIYHNEEEQQNRNPANLLPQHYQNQRVDADIRQPHLNPVDEHQLEWPRTIRVIYTFFSSFFISLIPDQPNIV
ncbi:homocysteine-responsive endoplasmic reticulum-resident ubiquitin-like domain member 2 protein [Phymastichus coffea]|uniref:homocysteine-responsive endoplasmic reticulum-resident ubiquitin-like domain member 2 protein n=1 Tax=Phymastichus coffea TaxID=108790 RepID=UPI00273BAB47|nr:homocysteine-responsive endoplasmic reticulum-resident ubiquitin-like domain member 2 protein [Phymastichus coffea]